MLTPLHGTTQRKRHTQHVRYPRRTWHMQHTQLTCHRRHKRHFSTTSEEPVVDKQTDCGTETETRTDTSCKCKRNRNTCAMADCRWQQNGVPTVYPTHGSVVHEWTGIQDRVGSLLCTSHTPGLPWAHCRSGRSGSAAESARVGPVMVAQNHHRGQSRYCVRAKSDYSAAPFRDRLRRLRCARLIFRLVA